MIRCASCGFGNSSAVKFCGECGAPLVEAALIPGPSTDHVVNRILAERAAMEAPGAKEGERKTITALFADIRGSVGLMEGLDPEDARRIVDPVLQLMIAAVHEYEGYVAQSRGDGIFALFGAPIAHEDHPRRALYAALRMQEQMERYAAKVHDEKGLDLQIGVGVNTGEVVVRSVWKDDFHTDYTPIGHSMNLAARLEGLAKPGSILVSDRTRRLTDGYIEFAFLGHASVKGVSEPVPLFEVVGLGPFRTKLEVSASRGLVPFVGRGHELEELHRCLELALAGRGQVVRIVGEPGVGKSRLLHEFKRGAGVRCRLLEIAGVSHGRAYPYLPLIELLKGIFRISLDDDEQTRRDKVASRMQELDLSLEDTLPYLFLVLGLRGSATPASALHQMGPRVRREKTFETIRRLLLREAESVPLLLIVEDLHWVDDETRTFLAAFGEGIAAAPILLVLNQRPELPEAGGEGGGHRRIRLEPLPHEHAEKMLAAMLGSDPELDALKRLILDKSEGNPFFIEEIVQELLDQDLITRDRGVTTDRGVKLKAPVADFRFPATVEGVLSARVDRLDPKEKEILQVASVIGREFSLALLAKASGEAEPWLRGTLGQLQAAEFLFERPSAEPGFVFKHALTRDVAYGSLLVEKRRRLHEQIGGAIEALFEGRLEEHYSELAHHYSHATNVAKAVDYLHRAASQAVQRSANAEAIRHVSSALEMIEKLPANLQRSALELRLQTTLGGSFMATRGYAAPEVGDAFGRARHLCRELGGGPQLFPVLWGLWAYYLIRAEYGTARELGQELLDLATREGAAPLLIEGHRALGSTFYYLARYREAADNLEQAVALYDSEQHRLHAFAYGSDPGVTCRSYLPLITWHLGYPELASKLSDQAVAAARELSHPFTLALALTYACMLRHLRRESRVVQELAEATIVVANEQGFPFWAAAGEAFRAWVLAQQRHPMAVAQFRQALKSWQTTGATLALPYLLALFAETCECADEIEAGLTAVADGMALVERTGEVWMEPELLRLRGKLLYALSGDEGAAEECFRRAVETARRHESKSLELRAMTSLSLLVRRRGGKDEAKRLLGAIYGSFTEGFDTADLRDAKDLLEG